MPRPRQKAAALPESLNNSGRRVACRNCRQAKMRCELSAGGRLPCARCRRMDRECKIDMEFKRINKQEKLEELENELKQLRTSISTVPVVGGKLPETNSIATDNHSVNSQSPVFVKETELSHDLFRPAIPSVVSSSVDTASKASPPDHLVQRPVSGRHLDHINIDPCCIHKLFLIFFNEYHHHVPLLTPSISPEEYYQKSPLLFWTIVYVASRRYAEEPDLVVSLIPSVKKLLWESIANPPHSLELVQSILLVCAWPFPTSSITTDNTVTFVSTAHTIATRLGLHRPEAIRDFSRTNRRLNHSEICDCLKTWAVCYISLQSVTTIDGQPSAFTDWTIERISKQDPSTALVPAEIHQQLRIYRFEARASSTINGLPKVADGVPRSGESSSLLALLEQEYFELCDSFENQLTHENSIILDGMGLRFYVFYLIEPTGSDLRKRALLRAFNLATRMLHKFSLVAERPNFTECAPLTYFQIAALGAMLILKITYSNYARFIDCEEGKRMFHGATQLIRRLSLEDNDLPGRMSKILTQLWSAYARVGAIDEEPTLKLRTRLSASLLHDILWCWRETFGGQGSNNNNGLVAGNAVNGVVPNAGNLNPTSPFGMPAQPATVSHGLDPPSNLSDGYEFDMLGFEDLMDSELMSLFPLNFEGGV